MPNPKPRTHLLCPVCKKRERVDAGLCRPCKEHFSEAAQSSNPADITLIIKEDTRRQQEDIDLQRVKHKGNKTLFDTPDNGGRLYEGKRKSLDPETEE